MIEAGCPLRVCTKCGSEVSVVMDTLSQNRTRKNNEGQDSLIGRKGRAGDTVGLETKEVGICECAPPRTEGVVLDPFVRSGIGIEISPEYCLQAEERLRNE